MNANMAALNMARKPKTEIIETMYPEDLAAMDAQAQPMQPGQPMAQEMPMEEPMNPMMDNRRKPPMPMMA